MKEDTPFQKNINSYLSSAYDEQIKQNKYKIKSVKPVQTVDLTLLNREFDHQIE